MVEQQLNNCKMCGNEIKRGVIKCNACGHFQRFSWRAFLPLSVTTMALVVAIITSSTTLIPVWNTARRPAFDEINIRLLSVTGSKITLFASNNGRKPGAIRSVSLHPSPETVAVSSSPSSRLGISDHRLVLAGEAMIVYANAPEGVVLPHAPGPADSILDFTVEVEIVRFDASTETILIPLKAAY